MSLAVFMMIASELTPGLSAQHNLGTQTSEGAVVEPVRRSCAEEIIKGPAVEPNPNGIGGAWAPAKTGELVYALFGDSTDGGSGAGCDG